MATELKVRALEKIYYIDAIREPGLKSRSGEPLDEFYLRDKKDFNPQFMEPLGWVPTLTEEEEAKKALATNEDGSHRTAEQIAALDSDALDEQIRQSRAAKANKDQDEFKAEMKEAKPKKKAVL